MTEAVNGIYDNNDIYSQLSVLEGTVDINSTEFTTRSGIKKDLRADAIEIIYDLVKEGKIDPWNIDIVDLYDKYMERITQMKQDNLRSIGKAILFSATLLKIKSDIFQGISINDFQPEPLDYFEDDFVDDAEQLQIPTNNVVSFDEVLQRRTSVRLNRKRNVTLDDLLRHIKFYEDLEKKYAIKNALDRKERRVRNYANLNTESIKQLAHEEYVEEVCEKMRQNLATILKDGQRIEIDELRVLGFDESSAFVALLFLEREGVYELYQEVPYGELFVQKAVHQGGDE